jgi:copper chaperone CopZ
MNMKKRLRSILVCAAMVVLMLDGGVPVAAGAAPQSDQENTGRQKTLQMRIAGMTCAACAKGLEASLRNMAGIVKAAVDYKTGQAVITFDTNKQSAESLSKFVASCGFQARETKEI